MALINSGFSLLPLGSVRPHGWLRRQLELQANSLSGHIGECWPDLSAENKWLGGERDGWERGPYYADGLVPLAYLLDDEALKKKADVWVQAFLDYQDESGWIGPVQGESYHPQYDPWPVFVVLKTLTQYYEVAYDERVLVVMERFLRFLMRYLATVPLTSWARFRAADLVVSIHWLYERTGHGWLLDLADTVLAQGYNWTAHFTQFRKYEKRQLERKMETHVVNNAMGIKAPGVHYRQSGDAQRKAAVYRAMEVLDRFHGQVNGMFSGDEHLAGRNPVQGTELCAVVEYMFSLEQLLPILGDPTLADRLETIAFNALPATFSPDMWAHQYDQQANQVLCTVAERDWTNSPDANIFGLEPNFGCCTANLHQGWPKLVSGLWLAMGDQGLAAMAYAPCEVVTCLGGQRVCILEDTDYPFGDVVRFTVEVDNPMEFDLALRIPAWANGAQVVYPGGRKEQALAGSMHTVGRRWTSGDTVELVLPMELGIQRRYHGSVSVCRGPLVFALPVGEDWQRLGGTLPHADWEVHPTTAWNYGLRIPPSGLAEAIEVIEKPVGAVPFSPEGAPVSLRVQGRRLPAWQLHRSCAGPIPHSPIHSQEDVEDLTLIPYGCTNLRITEFPLLED